MCFLLRLFSQSQYSPGGYPFPPGEEAGVLVRDALTQHTQFVWGETGALFGPLGSLQFGSDRLRPVKQLAYQSSIRASIPTNTQNIAV